MSIQFVNLCHYCSLRKNPDREAVLNRRGYWLCQECADNQRKAEIESDNRAVEYEKRKAEEKRQELLEKQRNNRTKVWVLLHTMGYAHDDVSVVAVYTSKEAAESAHRNYTEPGNCIVEESYLEG